MSAPTYTLSACPLCSSIQTVTRPVWKFASRTSRTGRNAYIFWGCAHTTGLTEPWKILDDPTEWAEVESRWKQRADDLLTARTAGWSPESIERLKESMEGRHFIPGTTRELALTEANPPDVEPGDRVCKGAKRFGDVEF